MRVWEPCPSGLEMKSPLWGSGAKPSEADDTFCENMLFCHDFKKDIALFAFIAYSVQQEMEEKNQFGGRKVVGQAELLTRWA